MMANVQISIISDFLNIILTSIMQWEICCSEVWEGSGGHSKTILKNEKIYFGKFSIKKNNILGQKLIRSQNDEYEIDGVFSCFRWK